MTKIPGDREHDERRGPGVTSVLSGRGSLRRLLGVDQLGQMELQIQHK